MNVYIKRKFLSLPIKSQHKRSADLLRTFYANSESDVLKSYNEVQEWMQLSPLVEQEHEAISNRCHWHLNQADIHLCEQSLLPCIRQGDREKPVAPKLDISIYLDQIRSAHNVGSILRTVEAFHLGDVYFSTDTPNEKHPQVKKTSMGSTKLLSYHHAVAIQSLPGPLIAFETCSEAAAIDQFTFPYPCCLAFGNEEFGLSKKVLEAADAIVEIPLYGRKNSLNVANAFAIAAAAISKQLRSVLPASTGKISANSKECYASS